MGLEDVPGVSPGDSGSGSSSQSQEEERVEIGSEPYRKVFDKERFEKIKEVISKELALVPGEVLSKPPKERYEILHEAALIEDGEQSKEQSDYTPEQNCSYCGSTVRGEGYVEIEGGVFCIQHTAAQVAKKLED